MDEWTDLEKLDLMEFARSIERDCQEAVKWEIRKLEWIVSDEQRQNAAEDKAA